MRLRFSCCVLIVALAAIACDPPSRPSPSGIQVNRNQYGVRWPFTVDSGYIDCLPPGAVVFRTASGTYGLNGLAKPRFPDVRPIWRDDPESPSLKVNIGLMIDLGLQQCH